MLISHPLDTLRVLVQTQLSVSLGGATVALWKTEGLSGFFKGIFSPVMAVGLWKAVMFSSSARVVTALQSKSQGMPSEWHAFAGGVAAGVAGLAVQVPLERIKIVAQTSPPPLSGSSVFAHETSIAIKVWRSEGLRGLYRGLLLNATLCPLAIGCVHLDTE